MRTTALIPFLAILATLAPAAAFADTPTNMAVGKPITASSYTQTYAPTNANDNSTGTYWEGGANAYPNLLTVALGANADLSQVVVKLNPDQAWSARTQTIAVEGREQSASTFTTLKAAASYAFDPATGNTLTIPVTGRVADVRLDITANSGAPGGQVAEFQVLAVPVQSPNLPDFTVSGIAFSPANPAATDAVTVTTTVRNAGSAAAPATSVNIYDGTMKVGMAAVGALAAGASTTAPVNIGARSTGSHSITAKVDEAGSVAEQNENNNALTSTLTVGSGQGFTDVAAGKPITASSSTQNFVAANADDGNVATYWEGAGGTYPNLLTVALGANADLSQVVVKLNPDQAWSARTQTIAVEGREQSASTFTTLKAAASYAFDPATGNTLTIPVTGRVADVRLDITANSGAPGGQVAEFQVLAVPAPNPDLTVSGIAFAPASPTETDAVTVTSTVRNAGSVASGATTVNVYDGTTKVGTGQVGGLAAGASAAVPVAIGTRTAGSHQITAKVDEANAVTEQNETNNSATSTLTVGAVQSSDLVATTASSPGNPAAGSAVTFTATLTNQGTVASAGGAHGITLTIADATSGAVVKTLTGSYSGAIAAGASAPAVNLGTWTATNGKYTITTVVANDANELPVKQANNTTTQPLFVGRGANMPYDTYEAEDGTLSGGAAVVGPNRTIGDLAGEASGRRAVTLNSTGAAVEFTTRAATNTLVTRFSIPDSAGGGGQDSTLDVYVNGTFLKAISLTSHYAWLYGAETGPGNTPSAGGPRHIYDEASVLLGTTVPAGAKIKLQKDAANSTNYAIDLVDFERATAAGNPDAAHYVVPAGFTQQDVQNALDTARQDTTKLGVYLPTGDYQISSKVQVYGRAIKVVGAGPWFTRFLAPSGQENTDIGFRADSTANGTTFTGFAVFGNYTSRIDGPGKVFDFSGVANMTIDNIWVEHQVCMFWGTNVDNSTIQNSRIRDTFADGINLNNGSTGNHVTNIEARSTGDDSFALFAATDNNAGNQYDNVFENLTAILPWRAAGLAVYGGYNNTFRNLYIADTLAYSGITVSSLNFGYPFLGFGPQTTTIQNASIVRAGGHFYGAQTFPAIWMFSASKEFRGLRISDVDITSPTYSGVMFQTQYVGGQAQQPIQDTVFTNVSITGAQRSGDAYDAKSGFGIWANALPEAGQGPPVGAATFTGLTVSNNAQDINNTTSTFTITRN